MKDLEIVLMRQKSNMSVASAVTGSRTRTRRSATKTRCTYGGTRGPAPRSQLTIAPFTSRARSLGRLTRVDTAERSLHGPE